jgi:alpha-mannosidase
MVQAWTRFISRWKLVMLPFAFSNDNIQFSAFKHSYDGIDYILRFFENQGRKVTEKVNVNGFTKAFLSNMNKEILEKIDIKDNSSLNLKTCCV